jgi:hypothetical protein
MIVIHPDHKRYLDLLDDWQFLDIESLHTLSGQMKSRSLDSIRRILKRLEHKKAIKIYRDPWTKKNFYYLNSFARKFFYPQSSPEIEETSLYHDLLVSRICLEILKYGHIFKSADLEHRIKGLSKKSISNEIVPDARIHGELNGKSFIASIELELHQKEKRRIIGKAKNYLNSSYYNHAFYFFSDENTMNNYCKTIKEELGDEFNQKIFLFYIQSCFAKCLNLSDGNGFVSGKQASFDKVFGGVR